MTWAAAFEKDGSALKRAWVIGPVFYQDVSLRGIEHGLQYYNSLETSVAWTMQLYEVLKTVPVLQCTVLHRYALMMHYCLTGNHLTISDINSESLAQGRKFSAAACPRPPQGLDGRAGAFADGAHRRLELQAGAFRQYGASARVCRCAAMTLCAKQDQHYRVYLAGMPCRHRGRAFAGGSLCTGGQLLSNLPKMQKRWTTSILLRS